MKKSLPDSPGRLAYSLRQILQYLFNFLPNSSFGYPKVPLSFSVDCREEKIFMPFLHENTPMSYYGPLGCKLFCGSGLDVRFQQLSVIISKTD